MAFNENRTFGVELEVEGINVRKAREVLASTGLPYNANDEDQGNHSKWSVHLDGSLEHGNGAEIVSPILKGKDGLAQVEKVCKALRAAGAKVSANTGTHVHVGARDLTLPMLRTLVHRYAYFETAIDALVSVHRRGNNNTFSRGMRGFITEYDAEMKRTDRTVREFVENICSRYYKLNLCSIHKYNTVEFRQHQGTVDHTKITNWIQFVVNFVEEAKAFHERVVGVTPAVRTEQKKVSRNKMVELLAMLIASQDLGVGLSLDSISQKLGWGATTVPVMLSALRKDYGVTLRKFRGYNRWSLVYAPMTNEATRTARNIVNTMGRANVLNPSVAIVNGPCVPASAAAPASALDFSGDAPLKGLPVELQGWFQEREFELADRIR